MTFLKNAFSTAHPFPFVKIENFLVSVNEKKKVQITDAAKFPSAIARLNDALASSQFLSDLSYITGMPMLLADPELVGGGMHITGPGGRLDVHVDFNYIEERKLHRRLNLLLYLNPVWDETWGGHIQLWDTEIRNCEASFAPTFNRCVIFETNEISYHGVTPISAARQSPGNRSRPTTTRAKLPRTGMAPLTARSSRPGRMRSSANFWQCRRRLLIVRSSQGSDPPSKSSNAFCKSPRG